MSAGSKDRSAIGQTVAGRYLIEEKIGEGGFGAVYRATHLDLGRPTAIKFIARGAPTAVVARFRREARIVANLRHPNIVAIHDFGISEGRLWLAQEYVPGRSLAEILEGGRRIAPERAVTIARGVLAALSAAHRSRVTHRDIKPGNVMLTDESEEIRLLDFGIARTDATNGWQADTRLTCTGAIIGTPLYIAPEQATRQPGTEIGPPTDIYGLGAVLFEMLAGAPPFSAADALATVIQHIREPVPPLPDDIPRAVAAVVYRALAKLPEDRYADAHTMSIALADAIGPCPASRGNGDDPPRGHGRAAKIGLFALACALLAFTAWRPAPPSRSPAAESSAALVAQLADASLSPGTTGAPERRDTIREPGIASAPEDEVEPAGGIESVAPSEPKVLEAARVAQPVPGRALPPTGSRSRARPSMSSVQRIETALRQCRCERALSLLTRSVVSNGTATRVKWPMITGRDRSRLADEHRTRCLYIDGACIGRER